MTAGAVYRGYGGYHGRVTVERGAVTAPLRHYVRHSPSGFAWGYGGSGPADLARCLLIDHLNLHKDAISDAELQLPVSYQDFKFQVVAEWPWPGHADPGQPAWELTSEDIDRWLEEARRR